MPQPTDSSTDYHDRDDDGFAKGLAARESRGQYGLDDEDDPLSLAEEIAAEAAALQGRDPRPLRADQAVGRHPHRRTAADVDGRVDRGGPQGKPHRLRRHQEARPGVQDSQGAGEAQRADVRRGDAGGAARRLRLPPQSRLPLPFLPGRHLRLAQPDSPLRLEDGGHGFRADPPAQGERAIFRPVAGRGDQLPGPQPAGQQGLLRRPDAAAPRRADPHGDDRRRDRNAGGRHDRAHRLRAARADRQPAAGRQDDPHAEDGQGGAASIIPTCTSSCS